MKKNVNTYSGKLKYYIDRKLHRDGSSVLEWQDGYKEWYLNGDLHREGGPAIEYGDGSKEWWFNGKLHREDGPAKERANGTKEWWFNGKRLSKQEWFDKLTEKSKMKILFDESFIKG